MSADSQRGGALLIVDDDNVLVAYLSQVFETRGIDVVVAPTLREGVDAARREAIDVIVASASIAGAHTGFYEAVIERRPELRDQFVLLARGSAAPISDGKSRLAPVVDPWDVEEIIRFVEEASRRALERRGVGLSAREIAAIDVDRPTLLLVEDGALELMTMKRILADVGFEVTPADCGNAAIALLQARSFDVILSDWYMNDGSGAELYAWLRMQRPEMVLRIVFMSGGSPKDLDILAPGRRLIPKGQDSGELFRTLRRLARGE